MCSHHCDLTRICSVWLVFTDEQNLHQANVAVGVRKLYFSAFSNRHHADLELEKCLLQVLFPSLLLFPT